MLRVYTRMKRCGLAFPMTFPLTFSLTSLRRLATDQLVTGRSRLGGCLIHIGKTHSTQKGQAQRRAVEVNAEIQAQHVEFEALLQPTLTPSKPSSST